MSDSNWVSLNTAEKGPAFTGSGSFHSDFSNFAYSPITIEGKRYKTVEHYFQASKAVNETDHEYIRLAPGPGSAKVRGRKVPMRPDWEEVRYQAMLTGLRAKFAAEPFRTSLLTFSGDIVEWNSWHDRIWGVCTCRVCGGTGLNLLGKALEEVRAELLAQS